MKYEASALSWDEAGTVDGRTLPKYPALVLYPPFPWIEN